MAFLQMDFYAQTLDQEVCVNIILPENKDLSGFKTLWLLHGLSNNHNGWMRSTAVERYAKEHDLAVVMPCVDRSWYTDTAYGKKYFSFLTEELPELVSQFFKGYSSAREDNLIIGLSMGGYGALKAALTCPEKYGFCASLSGSLDITRKNRPYRIEEWRSIFGYDLQSAEELAGTKHDLFALARSGKDFPYLYLWCGEEDSLIDINRQFSAHLSALEIPHAFHSSEGDHTWKWWDIHLEKALAYWSENMAR